MITSMLQRGKRSKKRLRFPPPPIEETIRLPQFTTQHTPELNFQPSVLTGSFVSSNAQTMFQTPRPTHASTQSLSQESTLGGSGISSVPTVPKQKRKKYRGKGLQEIVELSGKLTVVLDPKLGVPLDENISAKFTSEIGSIVRSRAPVCRDGWSDVTDEEKDTMRKFLEVLFIVDLTLPEMVVYVDQKMAKCYSSFKYRLHKHYLKCGSAMAGRSTLPPPDLWRGRPLANWHYLCDNIYTNAKFLGVAATNSRNRKEQKYQHRGGARPFVQHAQHACKDGQPLSIIDTWRKTHTDANGQWINDIAREKYESMIMKRDEYKEKMVLESPIDVEVADIEIPLEVEMEIAAEVCGSKGSIIRGVGEFPRIILPTNPSTTTTPAIVQQVSEMQVQMEQCQHNMSDMMKVIQTLQKENALLRTKMDAISTSDGS